MDSKRFSYVTFFGCFNFGTCSYTFSSIEIFISASLLPAGYATGHRAAPEQDPEVPFARGQRGCRYSLDGAGCDDAAACSDMSERRIPATGIAANREDEPHPCLGRDETASRGHTRPAGFRRRARYQAHRLHISAAAEPVSRGPRGR